MDPLLLSLILLALGIAFSAIELFVPSGGVLACLAVVSVVAAIAVGFTGGVILGAIILGGTTLFIPLAFLIAVRLWPLTPIGRRLLIQAPTGEDVLPDGEQYRTLRELVGRRGSAQTEMLPGGIVLIDGREFDAVSEGMPIAAGRAVEVVDTSTNHIVVRPASGEQPEQARQPTSEEDVLSQPIDSLGLDPFEDPLG